MARRPKGMKTYLLRIEKGDRYRNISTWAESPQRARDWYQRVSRTGRYKGRKDISGIKQYHGWKLEAIKQRKEPTRRKRRAPRRRAVSLFPSLRI